MENGDKKTFREYLKNLHFGDRFLFYGGTLGFVVDTFALLGINANVRGLIIENVDSAGMKEVILMNSEGYLLLTGLIAFYSVVFILWFLIRLNRLRIIGKSSLENITGAIDAADFDLDIIPVVMWNVLIFSPYLGTFVIFVAYVELFLVSMFITFFPMVLWWFVRTQDIMLAVGNATHTVALFSHYAIIIGFALDNFFRKDGDQEGNESEEEKNETD